VPIQPSPCIDLYVSDKGAIAILCGAEQGPPLVRIFFSNPTKFDLENLLVLPGGRLVTWFSVLFRQMTNLVEANPAGLGLLKMAVLP